MTKVWSKIYNGPTENFDFESGFVHEKSLNSVFKTQSAHVQSKMITSSMLAPLGKVKVKKH